MTITEPLQLGVLLRRLRLSAGLSQEQLAERSGLSARAISDLERGLRSQTRPETLRMLANGLSLENEAWETVLQTARPEMGQSATTVTTTFAPVNQLPVSPTVLLGRDRELTDLVSRLTDGDVRLVTLTGPGGVGKTRLALEAATLAAPSFPDRAVFVDLAPVSDPLFVPSAIAQALGIRESGERSIHETLRIALGHRRILLVLDNFEQVIEAAPVVTEMLARAPGLRVLVTSREALRVRGEEGVTVDPLNLPTEQESSNLDALSKSAAVALFVQAAGSAKSGFGLTADNGLAVAEICRRLDGLPLAIELAASRIKHFSPATLLDHLERRLPVLTGGPRDVPSRQQTLRDTIAWSCDLLSADEQALFRRLSVFAGGASLPAIESVVLAVGTLGTNLLSGLASLVDKSLLREQANDAGDMRFSMLETIREFAQDKLKQCGEQERARRELGRWALSFVAELRFDEQSAYIDLTQVRTVNEEIENIREAISYFGGQGNAEACAKLFVGLFNYFYIRGRFREAWSLAHRSLELAEAHPLPDELRGVVLTDLAIVETMLGNAVQGEPLARDGLALMRRPGKNTPQISEGLINLAITVRDQGRHAEAMEYAQQAHAASITANHLGLAAFALYHIGKLAFLQNDMDRAETCLTGALHQSRDVAPNTETVLYCLVCLAALHTRQDSPKQAAIALREAEQLWRSAAGGLAGRFLNIAAVIAASVDRSDDAVRIFGACDTVCEAHGIGVADQPWIADVKGELRTQLSAETYAADYREGQSLSLDDTLVLMHDVLDQIEHDNPDHRPVR